MKTVIPLKNFVTRKEVLQNIKDNDGVCYLHIEHVWYNADHESLNNILDDRVDNGSYLEDLDYTPIKLDGSSLIFEVCAGDCDGYINQCEEEKFQ